MTTRKFIFATSNEHKVAEVKRMLPTNFELVSLNSTGFKGTLPERGDTVEKCAISKAYAAWRKLQEDLFAEDTGLEVEALDGTPGVYTARYAGEGATDEQNIDLLLKNLGNAENRKAMFRTVIVLYYEGLQWVFEGERHGRIATQRQGQGGFGYDPVFIPEGHDRTLAQLSPEEKDQISHRRMAVEKMVDFLINRDPSLPIIKEDRNELLARQNEGLFPPVHEDF